MRFLDSSRPRRPQPTLVASVVLALFLALLAIPGSGLRAQNPYPAGLSDQTITVNGVVRQFRVHVPAGLTAPRAAVFVLHGGGGKGLDVALTGNHPLSVFRTVADREGFVVVYPGGMPAADATGKVGWVDCRADNEVASNADDVGFLNVLVQRIGTEYGLDNRRLFMTGGSNGAQMTHAFAFHHADRVGAVATGSGSLPLSPKPGACTSGPSRPLPILILHGDADTPMPWAGGCVANVGGNCNRGRVISAEATRDRWLQINGLQGVVPTQATVEVDANDGGPAQRFDYAGTTPLQWWRLNGAGHTTPSRTVRVAPNPTTGIQSRDIEFAEVVWAFFANQLPKADDTQTLPMQAVEQPGNAADTRTGLGAVSYRYSISRFEVTAGQYTAFLNAVARADPYGLYDSNPSDMATWATGPRIQRSGSAGSYTYSVAADDASRPINFISWGDAARFVNWLHNGQPTGAQGPTTTERGAYTLDGATSDAALLGLVRSPGARYALPTENEWYKAAYFDPTITASNRYWSFATRSDATPSNQLLTPDPGNNANFYQNNAYSLPGFLRTNVGDFENSEGPWGTFDQMGNVGEWTETLRSGAYAVRGESYSTGDSGGTQLGHRFVRAVQPSEEETKNGFRVVSLAGGDGTPVLQARADRVQGVENATALLVPVLANDQFTPSRLASVSLQGQPTTGTASVETQGTSTPADDVLRYVPPRDWSGVATMAYRVCEASRCSSSAQVSVQIAPIGGGMIELPVPAQRGFVDVTLSGLRALPGVQFAASSLSAPVISDLALAADATPETPWDGGRVGTAHVSATLSGAQGALLPWQVFAEASGLGGDVDLYLGEDVNGDGQPSENELRCTSAMSAAGERCELPISVPAGGTGRYWAMLHNRGGLAQTGRLSRYEVPLLSSDGSLVTTAPGILSAGAAFPLRVQWDDPTLLNGESRVGYVQMQLSGNTQAVFPVKLTRTANDSSALALISGEDRTLRLAGNGSHEQLFIDVPAGATQLTVTTTSASNVDVYLARVPAPVAGSAVPSIGLAPPRNQAQASGTTPGGNESVTVANPAAGRWYVTPVNLTASSATVVVRPTVTGTAPVVRPGGYYNTGRSGHGLFLFPADGVWAGLWYTYLQDQTPTWYYLQGTAPGANGLWQGTIYRGTWLGGSGFLTVVGEATVTPTGPDAFTFTYALDGQMGSEALSPLGRGCPTIGGAVADISQHYFDPARSGTGYSAQVMTSPGPYEFYAAFVYDARGVARFLVAESVPGGRGTLSIPLQQLTGFCPLCGRGGEPARTSVGTLKRFLGDTRLTEITVSANFVGGVPGAWNAIDTLSMLDNQQRTQGCQP